MSVSDIFQDLQNPATRGLAIQSAPSLFDTKMGAIAAAGAEKQGRLDPAAQVQSEVNQILSRGISGSSFLGGLSSLADASIDREFEDISNFATGESNPNLMAEADARSGVDPALRAKLQQSSSDSIDSLAEARIDFSDGNYLDSAGNVLDAIVTTGKVLPELAVDSLAGSIASGVAGTVLTGGIGGAAALGKRIFSAGKTVGNITDSVDKAVKAKNAKSRAGKITTAVGNVSLSTAAVLQRNEEAYIAENGEASSTLHKVVNAPAAVALMLWDRKIFMSAVPTIAGAKAAAKARKEFVKGVTSKLDPIPKKYAVAVAKKTLAAAGKAAKIGGAEATQEYLQSWHSILQSKMDDASLRSAMDQLLDEGNIDETNYAGLVGAMVGGASRGATSVPGIAATAGTGVAVNTGRSVAKVAGKAYDKSSEIVKDSATRASLKLYTADERAAQAERNAIAQKEADTSIEKSNSDIAFVNRSKSVSDISENTSMKARLEDVQRKLEITTEELNDPDVLSSVKNRLISDMKGEQAITKARLKANSALRVMKDIGNNVADKSITAAQEGLDKVTSNELAKTAIAKGVEGIASVRNIKSSTARGVLNLALTEGNNASKRVVAASRNLDVDDIKVIAKSVKNSNPELAEKLEKVYNAKVSSLKNLGSTNDNITSSENLDKGLKAIAEGANIDAKDSPKVLKAVSAVIGGRIGDVATLEVAEKVLAKYKETDEYINGSNKATVDVLEKRLTSQGKRLRKPVSKEIKKRLGELGGKLKEAFHPDNNADVLKTLHDMVADNTPEQFKKKANEYLLQLDNITLPDITTEKGQEELDKLIGDAYDSVVSGLQEAAKSTKDYAKRSTDISNRPSKSTRSTKAKPKDETKDKPVPDTESDVVKSEESAAKKAKYEKLLGTLDKHMTEQKDVDVINESITPAIPKLISMFKDLGATSYSEVETIINDYDTLKDISSLVEALKKEFPDDRVKDESFFEENDDGLELNQLPTEEVVDEYKRKFPQCPVKFK